MAETIIKYNRPKDNSTVIYNGTGSGNYYDIDGEGTTPSFDPSQIDQRLLWKLSSGDMALVPKSSYNNAAGESSIAIGTFTQTNNEGELAIGKFNQSLMNETMFTIGDGTDENNRHNLIQVGNANTVINNHLSGTTSNFNSLTSTTVSGQTAIFNNGTFYSGITSPSATISAITANTINVNNKLTTDQLEAVSGYIQTLLSTDITVDNLTVTKAAHFFKLIIDEIKATQGQIIITPANAVIDKVSHYNGYYRCYFRATDGEKKITNSFAVNDQVVCQTFNAATGTSYNVSNTYYWRLCTGTGRITTLIDQEYVDCYYVNLSETDLDSNSISIPQKGDTIVQLGNRTDATRQAAIIISAYNSQFLDPTIKAPSIVQYDGINNYDLSSHRLNVISKNFNEFKGSFKTSTGDDIEQLIDDVSSGATAYLHTAWANSSDGSLDFTKDASGGSFSYIGTCTNHTPDDTSLIYSDYTWNYCKGSNGKDGKDGTDGTNGKDGKDGTDGTSGTDAEFYRLTPVKEIASVGKNDIFGVSLQYQIVHVSGNTTEVITATTSGYWVRFKRDDINSYYNLSTGTTTPSYTQNKMITNYHTKESKPTYLIVELVSGSSAVVKDKKVVNIIFEAGAALTVADEITATVQGQADKIDDISGTVTSHTNSISTLNQNFSSITTTVSAHTVAINGLDDDVYELSHEVSDISQTADQIQSTVTHLRANATNLFNFSECNFSNNGYQNIIPAVQSYGIECKQALSRVYNLGFNGEGGDFTVSFECKMFGLSTAQVAVQLCDKKPVEATYFNAVDSEWRKFTFTFKNVTQYIGDSSDTKPWNGFIDFENSNFAYSKFLVVRHLMITRGTCASEFQVSPKDMGNGTNEKFLEWSYGASIEKTNEKYNGMDVYRPTTIPSSGYYDYIYCNNVEVKQYKIYTLSFWAKGDANGVILDSYMYNNSGQISHNTNWVYRTYDNIPYGATTEGNYNDGFTTSRLTNEWKQYIIYFNNWEPNNRNIIACRYGYNRNGGNTNSFKICGVQIREGYWTKEQMNSESQITQRADYIEAKVNDVSVKIDSGEITLNGNTKIQGNLNITNSTDGLIVTNSQNKTTQIKPVSIGTFNDNVGRESYIRNVTLYQTQKAILVPVYSITPAQNERATISFRSEAFEIYLAQGDKIGIGSFNNYMQDVNGLYVDEKYTRYYLITENGYTPSTSDIESSRQWAVGRYSSDEDDFFSYHMYSVSTKFSLLKNGTEVASTTVNGTSPTLNLNYTAATTDTYSLVSESTIVFNALHTYLQRRIDTLIASYIVPSFGLNITTIPYNPITYNTIGYDGLVLGMGDNVVYFGEQQSDFKYGNTHLRISSSGLTKYAGSTVYSYMSDGTHTDGLRSHYVSEFVPLTGTAVREVQVNADEKNVYLQKNDEFVTFRTTASVNADVYFFLGHPNGVNTGRKIYVKVSVENTRYPTPYVRVYGASTTSNEMMASSGVNSENFILAGERSMMFLSNGVYWVSYVSY